MLNTGKALLYLGLVSGLFAITVLLTGCDASSDGWIDSNDPLGDGLGPLGGSSDDTTTPSSPSDSSSPSGDYDGGSPSSSNGEALCENARPISCGQTITSDTSDLNEGTTTVFTSYDIAAGNYGAPEVLFSWTPTQGTAAELRLIGARPTVVNHDLFVLENGCDQEDAIEFGFNAVEWEAHAQTSYTLVVDGYYEDAGEFTVELLCEAGSDDAPGDAVECYDYVADGNSTAPVQLAEDGLPGNLVSGSGLRPSAWTSMVAFEGQPGAPASHEGIDYIHDDPNQDFVDIFAALGGTVSYVHVGCPQSSLFEANESLRECGAGWGNHVVIDHGAGAFTRYAHLDPIDIDVLVGDQVSRCQRIAGMGNSGRSDIRHLHFELGSASEAFDPCSAAESFAAVHDPGLLF